MSPFLDFRFCVFYFLGIWMNSFFITNSFKEFYEFGRDVAFCAVEYKTIFLWGFHPAKQVSIMLLFIFSKHHNIISDTNDLGHFSSIWSIFCWNTSFAGTQAQMVSSWSSTCHMDCWNRLGFGSLHQAWWTRSHFLHQP